jgi:outer membrane protein OmpA-like peptidoglycan-associated protein
MKLGIDLILGIFCLLAANMIQQWNKTDSIAVSLHTKSEKPSINNLIPIKQILYQSIIWFDAGQTNFNQDSDQIKLLLKNVSKLINLYPNSTLEINGYTDQSGPTNEHQDLSAARANSVAQFLQKNLQIQRDHMQLTALGTNNPLDQGISCAAHARNRRVEIKMSIEFNDNNE